MTTFWTLENVGEAGGAEKPLADWGIDDVVATFASQAEETAELMLNGRRYDAAYLFQYQTTVIVRRDRVRAPDGTFTGGTPWFQGLVAHPTSSATGRNERAGCSLVGPWWYLDQRGFEQTYKLFQGWSTPDDPRTDPTFITITTARIFLGSEIFGGKLNTGEQIIEALTWALKPFVDAAAPPPFQIGSVTLAVDAPVDEVKNITCAEAVRKMMRWSPDSVAWFDHSTVPPTFNCQRRADLAPFNLDVSATKPASIEVIPRTDLLRPYVRVQFERTNTIQGTSALEVIEQKYPDPLPTGALEQFGGVPIVVDLRGFVIARQTATIETTPIDTSSNDWWLAHEPDYKAAVENGRVESLVIDPASVQIVTENGETDLNLPNELIGGTPADWIPGTFQRLTARCKARVKYANKGELPDKTFSFQFVSTDAVSGEYSVGQDEAGDPIPVNLARDLYTAVSVLQYEGRISFQRAECGGLARPGHALNVLGTAQSGWATMLALVQRTTESIQHGVTEFEFGPPGYLSAGDLVSLLRVARTRQIVNPTSMRSNSYGGSGRSAIWGSKTARANSSNANGNWEKIVASGAPNPLATSDPSKKGEAILNGVDKEIILRGAAGDGDLKLKLGAAGVIGTIMGKHVEFRETRGCDPMTGAPRYCMIPRSEWYDTPMTNIYDV